ncbi:hypothetical protein L484_024065 [Morus notabilis]|uniref:RNase H type-1 domain-containing protein n=1 Tax=Morus notabilis TaxID=981085 RepID=W9S0G2_9ROSA|nr:hypothetical protein L484_024065 [Morus notabilis]
MPYCIFTGDNQTVIDCLRGIIQRPWEISNAFGFANSLKPSLEYVVFTKVYRLRNFTAHNLAKWRLACNVHWGRVS